MANKGSIEEMVWPVNKGVPGVTAKILNVGATRLSWGNILDSDSMLHAADRPFDVAMSGYSVCIYYLKTD